VIICVGYDMMEYHPYLWHPRKHAQILHIDETPAEVDEHYMLAAGIIGDLGTSLDRSGELAQPEHEPSLGTLRDFVLREHEEHAENAAFPMVPQRILWDLRQVLEPEDIVICDVGAHKMWTARLYEAERPNTCIISNGFASMGIGVPGAIAAKLAHPDRTAVTVTGDAGFLMNCQEIETALRIDLDHRSHLE
jgi:acetolactate synthase-1/2/3 large subunit